MGFWSGETQISVASTAYNLAGDQRERPNFLKTTIIGGVLSHSTEKTLGQQINDAYLTGPGIRLRTFAHWSQNSGYDDLVGLSASSLTVTGPVDASTLAPLLPQPAPPQTITVQHAVIDVARFTYWVDQWMLANYPEQFNTNWTCDFEASTRMATVTLEDGSVHTFECVGYDPAGQYLYATYFYVTPAVPAEITASPLGLVTKIYSDGPEEPPVTGSPGSSPSGEPEDWADVEYLIYKRGSGNADLDALFQDAQEASYFFPFIPIMLDKNKVSSTYLPHLYTMNKRALRKALGTNVRYDKLVKKAFSNSQAMEDVHFAYVTFGVSANVLEQACRRYIYQFMADCMRAGTNTVTITSNGQIAFGYWIVIQWFGITEVTGSGRMTNVAGDPAKVGECWWEKVYDYETKTSDFIKKYAGENTALSRNTRVRLRYQDTKVSWRYLEIDNLTHINSIFRGRMEVTGIVDAIEDPEESPFVFPLNETIYHNSKLVDSTQMSTACAYLMFNSYKIQKAPWYTRGWFKILLIVVGIAIAVFTGGAGTVGLLGTNLAVGSALGLTGTAAVVAGAVANALAAMVLVQIIQFGATKLLGPEIGGIVGAVLGVLAMTIGTGIAGGMDLSQIFGQLTSPVNLLKITEAAGNGYAQIMMGEAKDIQKRTADMVDHFDALTAEVQAKTDELMGYSGVDLGINPLGLTDVALPNLKKNILFQELPESFFSRTLLSGTQIVDLSMSFVNSFCDVTLNTKLPIFGGA